MIHTAVRDVAKKKKPDSGKVATRHVSFRAPEPLAVRMERTADALGLDPSNFLRLMLIEKLPEYEDRARRANAGGE
jgi:hypothetical protein